MKVSAEEIDRLIVAVNGTVITEGDLDIARNLNKLIAYGEQTELREPEDEVNRFIELELIRQEMRNLGADMEDEESVSATVKDLRDHYGGEEGLARDLAKIGVQESELISFLRLEFSIWKFIEYRFRSLEPVISSEDIEKYYNEKYVPDLRKEEVDVPHLEAVSSDIKSILEEEQFNDDLDRWLRDAKRSARIEYFSEYGTDVPGKEDSGKQIQAGTGE